jgi:hypothetical protein
VRIAEIAVEYRRSKITSNTQGWSFSLVFIASYILQVAMSYEFIPSKQDFSSTECSSP